MYFYALYMAYVNHEKIQVILLIVLLESAVKLKCEVKSVVPVTLGFPVTRLLGTAVGLMPATPSVVLPVHCQEARPILSLLLGFNEKVSVFPARKRGTELVDARVILMAAE